MVLYITEPPNIHKTRVLLYHLSTGLFDMTRNDMATKLENMQLIISH